MAIDTNLPHDLALKAGPRSTYAAARAGGGRSIASQSAALVLLAALSGAAAMVTLHHLTALPAELREVAKDGEAVAPAVAVRLARTTLLRLEDANRTSNYGVFRAAAAPSFQAMNREADLARIFGWMRNKGVSVAAAALIDVGLVGPSQWEPGGILHVKGVLPHGDEDWNFDLLFEAHGADWLLFGIAVYRG